MPEAEQVQNEGGGQLDSLPHALFPSKASNNSTSRGEDSRADTHKNERIPHRYAALLEYEWHPHHREDLLHPRPPIRAEREEGGDGREGGEVDQLTHTVAPSICPPVQDDHVHQQCLINAQKLVAPGHDTRHRMFPAAQVEIGLNKEEAREDHVGGPHCVAKHDRAEEGHHGIYTVIKHLAEWRRSLCPSCLLPVDVVKYHVNEEKGAGSPVHPVRCFSSEIGRVEEDDAERCKHPSQSAQRQHVWMDAKRHELCDVPVEWVEHISK
mmetsp:Transcript_23144/g.58680  ORF Transcript_23144/g.58680 Transcript_23144/m.58680 type:complete len:267 (-) Transcript_23144:222-1022(-)